ncbi:alpha/beta hydrolase [Chloroflexota bacterium]
MEHKEGEFRGYGNLSLYYQCWLPTESPKAVLLVVHGLAEHSGRYSNLVNYFVPKGYAVYGYDQRGHGKTEGLRGYVRRFFEYIEDLDTFIGMVRKEHQPVKIFLVGHSMGGLIATDYAARYQSSLSGLLLSGATLKVGSDVSPALQLMASILSPLLPKVGAMVLDASALSRDETVVTGYDNDPLVYRGKISIRLGAEMVKTIQKVQSRMPEIKLSLLIMHGTADRLSDPEGSRTLFERAGSEDKTLKLYKDFYHEIFNEPEREQVFNDMKAWLTAHV